MDPAVAMIESSRRFLWIASHGTPKGGLADVHRKSPSKGKPGPKAGGTGVGADKAREDNSGFGPIMGPVDAFGLKVYPWHPGSNAYFMFSNTECIAMGGGGTHTSI